MTHKNFNFTPRIGFADFLLHPCETLFMLCGVSYTGKSEWIRQVADRYIPNVVLSADEYVSRLAHVQGITYQEAWNETSYKEAREYLKDMAAHAVKLGINVYWDQTNLVRESRKEKLALFPLGWKKIAVYLKNPGHKTLARRFNERGDQTIPWDVLEKQIESLEPPNLDEGFNEIWEIENEGW